jgi:hypothetical protein
MFDLHLCLSASVNIRYFIYNPKGCVCKTYLRHTTLRIIYKILVGNLFVHYYFSPPPPFLLILSILWMVNTRNCNTNAENNDAENNNATNPSPTLEQVLMMQAQMLQTMQYTMINMHNAQHQAPPPPPPPRDKLGDFQCTKPPTFSHSIKTMDADDWLKSVEKKLQVVQCNN